MVNVPDFMIDALQVLCYVVVVLLLCSVQYMRYLSCILNMN